jgi:hypothetical protein
VTIHQLVNEVQAGTGVNRFVILQRARESWPNTVDFKAVQVRLLSAALLAEQAPLRGLAGTGCPAGVEKRL